MLAEVLLEGEALGRRIAETELELGRRIEPAVGEIAARLGAGARGERRLEEFRRQLDDVVERLAALLARLVLGRDLRQRHAGLGGEPLDRLGEADSPSVIITKSKMLPFLPEEKSNHAIFWSLTKNEGVFSLLKGESPFHSRPAFLSFTRRPTTSETGRRARSSSRNWGEKRMGCVRIDSAMIAAKSARFRGGAGVAEITRRRARFPSYPQAGRAGPARFWTRAVANAAVGGKACRSVATISRARFCAVHHPQVAMAHVVPAHP